MPARYSELGREARPDPRERPAYALTEAARYVRVPVATLRSWVAGRRYSTAQGSRRSEALIHRPGRSQFLSFWNLIEAHVLYSLRREYGVKLQAVREAIAYAETQEGVQRLLLRPELRTGAGELFLDKYGELVHLTRSEQLAMKQVFLARLERIEWDNWSFPVRLYPAPELGDAIIDRPIAIDPSIAFGRPILLRRGIRTSTVAGRIDAGELLEEVAADYDLSPEEVTQALVYESAA